MAALAGMSVQDPLSPRELYFAARAKQEADWQHTSAMLAMIHNILAKTPKGPNDFNPLRQAEKADDPNGAPDPQNWSQMLGVFKTVLKGNEK